MDSAAARPRASVFGADAYPTLAVKSAAFLHSIARNHALVDGNKRLAWFATTTFLALNGVDIDLSDDDAFELVIAGAEGRREVEQIAEALSAASRPRP